MRLRHLSFICEHRGNVNCLCNNGFLSQKYGKIIIKESGEIGRINLKAFAICS